MKRVLAIILCLCLTMGLFSTNIIVASADGNETGVSAESQMSVEGSSALGDMIADVVNEQQAEDAEDDVNNKILNVTFNEKIATVELVNNVAGKVVVGIFEEDGKNMLATGIEEVGANAETVQVTVNIETMPQYFFVRAFLLDEKNRPLYKKYESDHYTQGFLKFINSDVSDYEEERVLNLDDNNDNNFVVFSDDTQMIDAGPYNTLLSEDKETGVIVVGNINEKVASLNIGEILYLKYGESDEDYIIVKVKSIDITDDTATIVADDSITLEEVFSVVKIDTEGYGSEADVDLTNADEGVTVEGIEEQPAPKLLAASKGNPAIEISQKIPFRFSVDRTFKSENGSSQETSIKFAGSVEGSFKTAIKVYCYDLRVTVEYSLEKQLQMGVSVTGKIDNKINLGIIYIPTSIPGISVGYDVDYVISFEGKFEAKFTVTGKDGFEFDTRTKKLLDTSIPTTAVIDTDLQPTFSVFVGVQFEPSISVLWGVVEVYGSAMAGVEISVATRNRTDTIDQHHLCSSCLEGSISAVFSLSVGIKWDMWIVTDKLEVGLVDVTIKFFEFYWSPLSGWGTGKCPNTLSSSTRKLYYTILDSNRKPIPNARITATSLSFDKPVVEQATTNSQGKASLTLQADSYKIKIACSSYITDTSTISISKDLSLTVLLAKTTGDCLNKQNKTAIATGSIEQDIAYMCFTNGEALIYGTKSGAFLSCFPEKYIAQTTALTIDASKISKIFDSGVNYYPNAASDFIPPSEDIFVPTGYVELGEAFRNVSTINCTGSSKYISSGNCLYDTTKKLVLLGTSTSKIPQNAVIINDGAFARRANLTTITIPKSVALIGSGAFSGTNIKTVTYTGTKSQWKKIKWGSNNDSIRNAKIVCSDGTIQPAKTCAQKAMFSYSSSQTAASAPLMASAAPEEDSVHTVQQAGLLPNEQYAVVALKGTADTCTFDSESILYIDQLSSDENGALETTCYFTESNDYVILILGACNHMFDDWVKVDCHTRYRVCTKCFETENSSEDCHEFGDFVIDTAPTATEPGTMSRHCADCTEKAEQTAIPAFSLEDDDLTVTGVKQLILSVPNNLMAADFEDFEVTFIVGEQETTVQEYTDENGMLAFSFADERVGLEELNLDVRFTAYYHESPITFEWSFVVPVLTFSISVTDTAGGTATSSMADIPYGTKATLSAVPDSGYEFVYWLVNGRIVYGAVTDITVNEDVAATPIFRTVAATSFVVNFYTADGRLISILNAADIDPTDLSNLPEVPTRYGYVGETWDYVWEDGIFSDLDVFPQYIKEPATYHITVSNGVVTKNDVPFETKVTVTPDKADGFLAWLDGEGNVVSTNFRYSFFVACDRTLVASYTGVAPDYTITVNPTSANIDEGDCYRCSIIGETQVNSGYTIAERGIVYSTTASTVDTLVIGKANVKRKMASTVDNGQFMYTLTGAPKDKTVTARIYMIIVDGSGNLTTVYSALCDASYSE